MSCDQNFCMKFFTTRKKYNCNLRIVTIAISELTILLILYFHDYIFPQISCYTKHGTKTQCAQRETQMPFMGELFFKVFRKCCWKCINQKFLLIVRKKRKKNTNEANKRKMSVKTIQYSAEIIFMLHGLVSGQKPAFVVLALDECVNGVAILNKHNKQGGINQITSRVGSIK